MATIALACAALFLRGAGPAGSLNRLGMMIAIETFWPVIDLGGAFVFAISGAAGERAKPPGDAE
ncbi:hypothetical protein M2322_004274 [Rhodoblastus acidophilus]|uniref:hypothetical protein n=1 Tax=Rhodoblastus acidophilus TaxID=1074 RepID=UPI002224A2B5|nr:hypothetical protein [Rhodoblastus acidophilus]MCW2318705.1 hypothetical protein [Rhodoblastus acidophilus]